MRNMPTTLAKNILLLRQRLKFNQSKFAKKIGVSQPSISRWEQELDIPEDVHIERMARLAGTSPAEFRYGTPIAVDVPVVGYVGAGEMVMPIDDHPMGEGIERVPPPPETDPTGLVAVRIKGDSMRPLQEGWVIFYRRFQDGVPAECLKKLCVVALEDGTMMVKELHRGYSPGRYNLHSWTIGTQILEDQALQWAAPVVAIKPS